MHSVCAEASRLHGHSLCAEGGLQASARDSLLPGSLLLLPSPKLPSGTVLRLWWLE